MNGIELLLFWCALLAVFLLIRQQRAQTDRRWPAGQTPKVTVMASALVLATIAAGFFLSRPVGWLILLIVCLISYIAMVRLRGDKSQQ